MTAINFHYYYRLPSSACLHTQQLISQFPTPLSLRPTPLAPIVGASLPLLAAAVAVPYGVKPN